MGLTLVNVKHAQIGLWKKSFKWRNQGKGGKSGENFLHWEWDVALKAKNFSEN
jgi:hypothetical protein